MATYVIGDVHGCFVQLQQLLEVINFNLEDDNLWFAGDLINGGPQPVETLRFIKSLGDKQVCVLGNHDLVLLGVSSGELIAPKDRDIGFEPVLESPDCEELIEWLRMRPLIHFDPKFNVLLVHAGVLPQWSLAQIIEYAHEVESILRSPQANELYRVMYGNLPDVWHESLSDWNRIRFLINCFTRMRFCSTTGQLDLSTKGTQGPTGFAPWFTYPTARGNNPKILFGHWAALLGKTDVDNAIALDTGCVWGYNLTALRLDDNKFFSVAGLFK